MKVVDERRYQDWKNKNNDPYGSCVFRYAERWADMMEIELEDCVQLKDIAEKSSHDANTEGITGYMYGMAANILSECWIHGEALKEWHNAKYNYDGDGIANPAIVTIED